MSRLTPLIERRTVPARQSFGRARAIAVSLPAPRTFAEARPAEWLDDLRLFATGWIGGLIFFGTLLA